MRIREKIRSASFYLLAGGMLFCCMGLANCPHTPHSSSVTPNFGNQGTDVSVTFNGSFFAATSGSGGVPAIIIDGRSTEGLTTDFNGSSDPYADTFINLTLHIAPTARLGAHTIAVETDVGVTLPQTFNVICTGCPPPPGLSALFTLPEGTRLVAGGAPVTFRFVGTNLLNNNPQVQIGVSGVTPDPAAPVVQQTGCPSCLDYFDLPITAATNATPALHDVWVTTAGGTSNVLALNVDASTPPPTPPPSPSPGATPFLRRVTPTHLTKGGPVVSIKCEGYNFGQIRDVFGNCCIAGTFRTVLANPDQVAVSHLYPPDNVGSTLTVQVENDETLLDSNAQIVSLDDRIPGRPYVSSNPVGITAGGDADVIINGENLDGTTYLSFNGIPHLHFSNIVVVSSNRVNVHVHAEADTPITGDEATNLTITTPAGESNAFEFIVNRP